MKILITSLYNGQMNRGAESWVYQIFKNLREKGIDAFLVQGGIDIPHWIAPYEGVIIEKSLITHHQKNKPQTNFFSRVSNSRVVHKLKHLLNIHEVDEDALEFTEKIKKHLLKLNPDIYIPINGCIGIIKRFIRANNLKTKVVAVGHAGLPNELELVDAFIALSSKDYKKAQRKNQHFKLFRVSNGVDIELFDNAPIDAEIMKELSTLPRPIILCVAALVPCKRVHLAIEAAINIGKGSLLILGDGPEKERLNNLIMRKVPKERRSNFKILNGFEFSKMPTFYRLADILVHPADSREAFGSVIVEAMSQGKPVVLNDDEIRREIAGDLGSYVNPKNIKQFSEAILRELDNTDDLKKEALRRKAEEYSWDNVVNKYIKIFNEILN
ncbi:glycosyltransferase [Geobacillus stearothermophilus]|uniref:glycosyltransferase n=1 Tax=Geobacillus stearothermophilus TaxID=1422 RepID=UPI003D24B8ED